MSESVRNVSPSWIGIGWFIGAAITSFLVFVLIVLGLIQANAPTEGMGVSLALLIGFVIAGFVTGLRVRAAPFLHGLGMGLLSIIFWVVINLLAGEAMTNTEWSTLSVSLMAGLLVLQTASAIVGARAGVRFANRAEALP